MSAPAADATIYLHAVAGQYAGQKLPVGDGLVIGSGSAVELAINDPAIQARHARIVAAGNRVLIENLSDGDIWVNGTAVQRHTLGSGDEIRLGRQRFVVKIPGLRPDSVLREVPVRRPAGWLWWAGIATSAVMAAAAAYWYLLR